MKKILLFNLFLAISSLTVRGQNLSIEKLALNITKGLNDDSLKVVAICNWIFENVEYDWDTYWKLQLGVQHSMDAWTVKDILITRKAVCGGYSSLFKDLCQINKIEATYISGKALGDSRAWNAVRIKNKWYLMDITWADNIDKKPVANAIPKIEFKRDSFLMSLVSKEVQETLKRPPSKKEEDLLSFIESVELTKEEQDSLGLESQKKPQLQIRQDQYLWDNGMNMIKEHIPDDPFWQLLNKIKTLECIKNIDCLLENGNPNYGNHINEELKLDSITREYKSIERRYKYNPNDEWAISNSAYFFMKRGDDTYQLFLKQVSRLPNNIELLTLLQKAKKYYEISTSFYEKLKPFKGFDSVRVINIAYNNALISIINRSPFYKT